MRMALLSCRHHKKPKQEIYNSINVDNFVQLLTENLYHVLQDTSVWAEKAGGSSKLQSFSHQKGKARDAIRPAFPE